MGRDRLAELQELSGNTGNGSERTGNEGAARDGNDDLRGGQASNKILKALKFGKAKDRITSSDAAQNELQTLVNSAQNHLEVICENTRLLRELHSTALKSPHPQAENQTEIEARVADTQRACNRAYSTIKELERLDLEPGGAALRRMRDVQVAGLRVGLTRVMERHDQELQRYAKGLRSLLAKAVSIAKGEECSDAEVDQLLEDRKVLTFVDNYQDSERTAKLSVLKDLTDRHSELLSVEKSISEIRDLFVQMGNLISVQGTIIDQVELHVGTAAEYATSGTKELNKAKHQKSKLRKRKTWLMIICGGIVLVGVLCLTLALVLG